MMFVKRANFSHWAQKICGLKETLGEPEKVEEVEDLSRVWGLPTPNTHRNGKKGRIIAIQRELVEGSRSTDGKREKRERERVGGRGR